MAKDIIEALNWRYATKEFDATKKLSSAQVDSVLEAGRLTASSFGLQPWKFLAVENPKLRSDIRAAAWNQTQVTDASHLVVLAVNKKVDASYVDAFAQSVSDVRGVPLDSLKGYVDMMKGAVAGKGAGVTEWSTRQVYIALGSMLAAAATYGIDATPMEGFDPKKVDEILGLEKLGLGAVVLLALGTRSSSDKTASYKKVRQAKDEVVIRFK